MSLGPEIPDPPADTLPKAQPSTRHKLIEGVAVRGRSILGGLHHEYSYVTAA
jgi:putative transposase